MLLTEHRTPSRSTQTKTMAAEQLCLWTESEEGQHIWGTADTLPSLERICCALTTTHAKVYGLLIAPDFFMIISRFHPQTFTRLADRYQAAARRGICFWYDGDILHHCEPCASFFAQIRTLPPLR